MRNDPTSAPSAPKVSTAALMHELYCYKELRLHELLEQDDQTLMRCVQSKFRSCIRSFEIELMKKASLAEGDQDEVFMFAQKLREDFQAELEHWIEPTSERLRDLRTKKGLSLSKLAKESGISKSNLSKYENGRLPLTAKAALRIGKAMQVSSAYLLCDIRHLVNSTSPETH